MAKPHSLPIFHNPNELAMLTVTLPQAPNTVLHDYPDGTFAIVEFGKEDVPLALCDPEFAKTLMETNESGGCMKVDETEEYLAAREELRKRFPVDPLTGLPPGEAGLEAEPAKHHPSHDSAATDDHVEESQAVEAIQVGDR